ncbi:MAG: DegT/DnrJ/EryC1/StrS family aminotransferase [Arenimonas sp.]
MTDELSLAAQGVIESGHFILGTKVAGFEKEFAAYCESSDCIGVANGTDALELALKGMGVEPGQNVIVCANAAMYGTSAVSACDANPVFVDVDLHTATICPDALQALLASTQEPIAAIIVTHLYGQLADMAKICALAERHGIAIIEDCAQAHGARDANNKIAGSFGKAATFSFYPTKNLGAIGDGGAVITSDKTVAERVRKLRQYGWSGKYQNQLAGGRNSRLDEMQAAFLSRLLPRLEQWNARRRDIANAYSSGIQHTDIRTPSIAGSEHVAHLYVINSPRRDALRNHLAARGIGTDIHYPMPDYRQALFSGRFAGISLPNTEALCSSCLTLPCFPELTDDEVQRVIDACNQF